MKKEYLRTKDAPTEFKEVHNSAEIFHDTIMCFSNNTLKIYDKATKKMWPVLMVSREHSEENMKKYRENILNLDDTPWFDTFDCRLDYYQEDLSKARRLFTSSRFDNENISIVTENKILKENTANIHLIEGYNYPITVKYVVEQEDKFVRIYKISEKMSFFKEKMQIEMLTTSITFNLESGKTYYYSEHPVGTKTHVQNITNSAEVCYFSCPSNIINDVYDIMCDYFKEKGICVNKKENVDYSDLVRLNFAPTSPSLYSLYDFFGRKFDEIFERYNTNNYETMLSLLDLKDSESLKNLFEEDAQKMIIYKMLNVSGIEKEDNILELLSKANPHNVYALLSGKYKEDMDFTKYPSVFGVISGLLAYMSEEDVVEVVNETISKELGCDVAYNIAMLNYIYLTNNFTSDIVDLIVTQGCGDKAALAIKTEYEKIAEDSYNIKYNDELSDVIDKYNFDAITDTSQLKEIFKDAKCTSAYENVYLPIKGLIGAYDFVMVTNDIGEIKGLIIVVNNKMYGSFNRQFEFNFNDIPEPIVDTWCEKHGIVKIKD